MQNSQNTWRVCVRKLPPSLSEEEFLQTEVIANFIQKNKITVKYYPAEAIGDTSAPASSMAIITITADNFAFKQFTDSLTKQTFKMTYCDPKPAQIEFAPCQNLAIRNAQPQGNNNRQTVPIDKDPEFIEFSSKFEDSYTPPTDALPDKSELEENDEVNAERNLNIMSQKLSGGKINSSGQNNGGNNGPSDGRKKRKNRKNRNQYTPGEDDNQ